jgi:hypothetical protein
MRLHIAGYILATLMPTSVERESDNSTLVPDTLLCERGSIDVVVDE